MNSGKNAPVAEIATDVSAEGRATDRQRDETHRLTKDPTDLIARQNSALPAKCVLPIQ